MSLTEQSEQSEFEIQIRDNLRRAFAARTVQDLPAGFADLVKRLAAAKQDDASASATSDAFAGETSRRGQAD